MKNVIFDLGSVLFKGKASDTLYDLDINFGEFKKLLVFFDDVDALDLGDITIEEKLNGLDISNKYHDFLLHYYEHRKINMDLITIIKKLKEKNYNVYILSDNNKECINYYKKHELFQNIDGWIVSCDHHTLKKDGKLFDILLKEYNLNPEECYYIDDKVKNIYIGLKHGIMGFIFNENENIKLLYDDMKENGIDIEFDDQSSFLDEYN